MGIDEVVVDEIFESAGLVDTDTNPLFWRFVDEPLLVERTNGEEFMRDKMEITAYDHANANPNCYKCPAFEKCLSSVLDGLVVKCLFYGWLKNQVDEAVGKLNSVGLENPLSIDEVKSVIYFCATGRMEA